MVERIKLIMGHYQLRPAQFSDAIGMQRSAVSHVLSGRNKASLDFVLRIKKHYPEISLNWLLLGEGQMLESRKSGQNVSVSGNHFTEKTPNKMPVDTSRTLQQDVREGSAIATSARKADDHEPASYGNKGGENHVSRLILIYDNGTFRAFDPGN